MPFIEVMGFLGRDAEERMTPSNRKVVTITIAENVKKKGQVETMWWRCTIWGDEFNGMIPYFKKGTPLVVRGDFQQPSVYQANDGTNKVSLDISVKSIQFLPSSKQSNPQESEGGYTQNTQNTQNAAPAMNNNSAVGGFGFQSGTGSVSNSDINEDNLPF
ncbi:single-stranded DNA-binding protein [Chlamydiia bacterium]|nr:single-stranded DNA-binding protein [Chlamydiia bacterium]